MKCAWSTLLVGLVVAVAANAAPANPKLAVASARYGPAVYLSQRWGLVYSVIENPTAQDLQLRTAARFKNAPNMTYASKVWVPAGARRKIVQPLRVPQTNVSKKRRFTAINLQTTLLSANGTRELDRDDALVSVVQRAPTVVMIFDDQGYDDNVLAMVTLGGPSKSTVDAEKKKKGLRRTPNFPNALMRSLRGRDCPTTGLGWDAVDYVCIIGRDLHFEPAQFDALRRYLVGGGRVWIMLDRVRPAFGRRLIGEDFTVEIIDRVQRHVLTFDGGPNRKPYSRDMGETPVDMVRVAADGFDVIITVDGLPAAMQRDVGQGKLLITTVGAPAWIEEQLWDAPPLRDLASVVYRPVYHQLLATEDLAAFAQGQIGYEIIDRNIVGTALILFAMVLLVGGVVLAKLKQLQWHAPAAVILALVTTGVIMAMGQAHQSKAGTSPTIAGATWARVDSDQQYANLTGAMGFFSPREVALPITATRGGVVWPDAADRAAGALGMTWFGAGRWQWQLPPLKPGVIATATLKQTMPLDQRTSVNLTFTENQIIGDIQPGPFGTLSDLVLATPAGHMLPRAKSPTRFVIDTAQRSGANEFLGGSIAVTEVQTRHQEIYRNLLNPDPRTRNNYYPSTEMVLMGWTATVDNGISYVDDAQNRDETMVSIPVTIIRPQPGTRLTIPPQLITRHRYRGLGKGSASIYDYATDQFIARRNVNQQFTLGFRIPTALLPLQFDSLKLEIRLDANSWTLSLLPTFGDNTPLAQHENPAGTVTFELTDYEGFTPNDAGMIYVRCNISSEKQLDVMRAWDISQMQITAVARVPGPTQ